LTHLDVVLGRQVCCRPLQRRIVSVSVSRFKYFLTVSLTVSGWRISTSAWTGTCAVGAFAAGAPLFDDEGEGVCERKIIISQRISSFNDSPTLSLGILV
jgi:hypothetical protein